MEKIIVQISWSGKNYAALSNIADGVIITTHKTLEGVKKDFEESLQFHIEGMKEDKDIVPEYLLKNQFEIQYNLETSALLRSIEKYTSIAAISRATGINERQLSHYANSRSIPRPAQRKKIIEGIHEIGRKFLAIE